METLHIDTTGLAGCAEQFIASVHAERERVRKFLAAYQTRLEKAEALIESQLQRLEEQAGRPQGSPLPHAAPVSEYQRRYEMALNDLQNLKQKNAELQVQLGTSQHARPSDGKLDWEAEKRRVLAALEADFSPNDPEQRAERLRIEEVLRTTERVLAEKDRELGEIKQRLEDGANSAPSATSKPKADDVFDNDVIIREERQRLAQLQNEWREKIRQAEIDLSVERAKLARQRAELDERIRTQENTSGADSSRGGTAADNTRPSPRGRWLARLGITDAGDHERPR